MLRKTVANNVERLRKQNGWTRPFLTNKAGVHPRAYEKFAQEYTWTRPENLEKLAVALGVKVEVFFKE